MLNAILKNLSLRQKFLFPLLFILIGFLLFGWNSKNLLDELRINGLMYQKIVLGKDLTADILPPPEYAIESYLITLELKENIQNPELTKELSDYLMNKLKKE